MSTSSSSTLVALAETGQYTREALDALMPRHPGFPREGITFIDVLPLWRAPAFVNTVVAAMAATITASFGRVDFVAGIEARGFLLCGIAAHLQVPFVCIRKAGKLPGSDVVRRSYDLEYGSAVMEVQRSEVSVGTRGVLVDDLLATGGTAFAARALLEDIGATVAGLAVVVELAFLGGAARFELPVCTCLRL